MAKGIDLGSRRPLYEQIVQDLRMKIQRADLRPVSADDLHLHRHALRRRIKQDQRRPIRGVVADVGHHHHPAQLGRVALQVAETGKGARKVAVKGSHRRLDQVLDRGGKPRRPGYTRAGAKSAR